VQERNKSSNWSYQQGSESTAKWMD